MNPEDLSKQYLVYSRFIIGLAAALPVILAFSSWINSEALRESMSAYYHGTDWERNAFVAILSIVAIFLMLYKGTHDREAWFLNVAGVSALGVAFFPDGEYPVGSYVTLHGIFAVILFVCLFIVGVVLSKELVKEVEAKVRARLQNLYRLWATGMVVGLAIALVGAALRDESGAARFPYIFLAQLLAVWSFAAFWVVRMRQLDPKGSLLAFVKRRR